MPTETTPRARVEAVLAQPDPGLLERIRSLTWTGHNIPLTATESTLDPGIPRIGDDPRTLTIKALVRRYAGASGRARVLDLGSLEGGLALEMAREGWDVVGIEGRRSNFEKAELIRSYFGLENLRFEHRDVKSLDRGKDGVFDAVLCCGLLYHLDDPFSFLRRVADLTAPEGFLFVDTHVAPEAGATRYETWAGQLSEPATVDVEGRTYEGRWFHEPSAGSVLDQQWSAISNERSFWPTRLSLIRGVYDAGFHSVAELYGAFEIDREIALRDQFSRLYLLGRRGW